MSTARCFARLANRPSLLETCEFDGSILVAVSGLTDENGAARVEFNYDNDNQEHGRQQREPCDSATNSKNRMTSWQRFTGAALFTAPAIPS